MKADSILDLPNELLFKIIENVPPVDRHSVAAVCHRFADVIRIPLLWSYQEFCFNEHTAELLKKDGARDLHLECSFVSHWKNLTLTFTDVKKKSNEYFTIFAKCLESQMMKFSRLKRLTVTYEMIQETDCAAEEFVSNFIYIFSHDSQLSQVDLRNMMVSPSQGVSMLQALMKGCGTTLTTLRLVDFIRKPTDITVHNLFENAITSFSKLRILDLNISYLRNSLLVEMAERYPGQLQTLIFRVTFPQELPKEDCDYGFKLLLQACPKLKVRTECKKSWRI